MKRLWVHEVLRVFYDRLVDEDDRSWLFDKISYTVKNQLQEDMNHLFANLKEANSKEPVSILQNTKQLNLIRVIIQYGWQKIFIIIIIFIHLQYLLGEKMKFPVLGLNFPLFFLFFFDDELNVGIILSKFMCFSLVMYLTLVPQTIMRGFGS